MNILTSVYRLTGRKTSAAPSLVGAYLFADRCDGTVHAMRTTRVGVSEAHVQAAAAERSEEDQALITTEPSVVAKLIHDGLDRVLPDVPDAGRQQDGLRRRPRQRLHRLGRPHAR